MNKDPFISRQIDLNIDIAQGFGEVFIERDLLSYATSVNLSAGAHTGEPAHTLRCIEACKEFPDLALGALVSYPDVLGYGLRRVQMSNEELRASILAQLGSVAALARACGYELQHVRAHGYLYQQLITNYSVAETVAKAVQEFSKWLILVGPTSTVLDEISKWTGLRVASEARFDLRYRSDLSLEAFDLARDAELDIELAAQRARDLVYKSIVKIEDSQEEKALRFETIHLPSRLRNSLEIAKLVRGMILKPLPLKTVDYEPYLSEFI